MTGVGYGGLSLAGKRAVVTGPAGGLAGQLPNCWRPEAPT